MGPLGFGNIGLKGNTPAGPPFVPTSAENGLSVDPVTGRIVLGNNAGAALAALLSNREIPLSTFSILFSYPTAGNSVTIQNDAAVDLLSLLSSSKNRGINVVFTRPAVTATGLRLQNVSTNGGIEFDILNDGPAGMFVSVGGSTSASPNVPITLFTGVEARYHALTAGMFFGWQTQNTRRMALLSTGLRVAADTTNPGARLSVDGAIAGGKAVFPRNLTPYNLPLTQNGFFVTNEGASALIVINLPALVASGEQPAYGFLIQNAFGMQITAAAGETITVGGVTSAAAGTATSTTIGSTLRIVGINGTQWMAFAVVGTWVVV